MIYTASSLFLAFLSSTIRIARAQSTATISAPAQAASASPISKPLDPSFAGFGIESSNLFSFTGGSSKNDLSINLLTNLAQYAGRPPHLRIGGNTQDYIIYDSTYSSYNFQPNPGTSQYAANHLTAGPGFFKALDRFPQGSPVTFGLNMAYQDSDYVTRITTEAQAALDNLKNVNLISFEIGNEPDLWLDNGFRKGAWNGQIYTQEWLLRAAAVYQQVLQPAGIEANFFESPATASTIGNSFEIAQLVQDGITKGSNGTDTYLAGWNQHDYFYFVGVTGYPLTLDYMMRLRNTEVQFEYWAGQIKIALGTGFPYYLREMASAGPIGLEGISDTFGAALWTFNFFCYAATLGIGSVGMHMTDNSFASAWQPITMYNTGPHVRPSYYAFAAMAQLIGSGNGTTQIAPLAVSVSSDYADYIRAYAVYASGSLSSVVVINARPANASVSNKPSLSVKLSLPSAKGQTLYLSLLTAAGADSTSSATWNGISYEQSGRNGLPVSTTSSSSQGTVQIANDGSATISLRDSSALVANIGYLLGSRGVSFNSSSSGGAAAASTSRARSAGTTSSSSSRAGATALVVSSAVALASSVGASGGATARSGAQGVVGRCPGGVALMGVLVGVLGLSVFAR